MHEILIIRNLDIMGLAEAIAELILDENLRRNISIEARKTASKFDIKSTSSIIIKVYENILEEKWW